MFLRFVITNSSKNFDKYFQKIVTKIFIYKTNVLVLHKF
jgi:hypothetical protein